MIALSDPRLEPVFAMMEAPFERVESIKNGCIGYQAGLRVQISKSNSLISKGSRALMRVHFPWQEMFGPTNDITPQQMPTLLKASLGPHALRHAASLYRSLQGSVLRHDPSQSRVQVFRVGSTFQIFGIGLEIFRSKHLAGHFGCFINDVGHATLRADWQYVEVCLPQTQHERLEILHNTQTPWHPF